MRAPQRSLRAAPKRQNVAPPVAYRQGRRSRPRFWSHDVEESFEQGFEVGYDVARAGNEQRNQLVEEYLRGRSLDQMSALELHQLGSALVEMATLAFGRAIQAQKRPRLELISEGGELTDAGRRLLDDLDRQIDIPLDDPEEES